MTKKLYYEDSAIKEFKANVLRCEKCGEIYKAVLDSTAFFPEGGGQPCDLGTIEGIEVIDVQEKDGEIFHSLKGEISGEVTGKIDWQRRFDLSVQHSGEHIVSGFVHEKFGLDNVGFHMGDVMITVDFNGELNINDLEEIEKKANNYIWENHKTEIFFPSDEEIENLDYRSKKEIFSDMRIVKFPEADMCACCGTHVEYTGEIGFIKIVSCTKFHSGARIEMLSGKRAFEYLSKINNQNRKISVLLSAKVNETSEAVNRLLEENRKLKFSITQTEERLLYAKAENLKGKDRAVLFEEELSADNVRKLASMLIELCSGRCYVFSGSDKDGYKYAIAEKGGNLKDFIKQFNSKLNGRGGGKPFFVQGSVNSSRKEIEEYISGI